MSYPDPNLAARIRKAEAIVDAIALAWRAAAQSFATAMRLLRAASASIGKRLRQH